MRISSSLLMCAAVTLVTTGGSALAGPCYSDGSCRLLRTRGYDQSYRGPDYTYWNSDSLHGAPDSPELHRPSTPEERAQTGRLNRQALADSEARGRATDARFAYEMTQYQRDLRAYHDALQAYDRQMAFYNQSLARGRREARPVHPLPPRPPQGARYRQGYDSGEGRPAPYRGP